MSVHDIALRLLHYLRPPRKLRFTKEGTRFVVVSFAIGIAAINTGNNLLYLILAMVLSMILLSGILSESSLRMVAVKRSLPGEVFSGKPFLVRVTASNVKKRLPSISLTFQDNISGSGPWRELYFLNIPPSGKVSGSYPLSLDKRGIHLFTDGRLSTRYPFGLFLKSRDAGEENQVLVFPRILDVRELLRENGIDEGELESRIKGRGTDLYGLRGYVSGDDMRAVHWKTSAKLSKLYVREFSMEDARRVTLFLDNCISPGMEDALEKGISIAASLASHFIYKGYQVGLVTSGDEHPLGIGARHLYSILRSLALVNPGKDRESLVSKVKKAEGILILPSYDLFWKGKEGLFSKVIRVTL